MSFGTLDAKSKELVLDILLSIISSSYTKMKYATFFGVYYKCKYGGMGFVNTNFCTLGSMQSLKMKFKWTLLFRINFTRFDTYITRIGNFNEIIMYNVLTLINRAL